MKSAWLFADATLDRTLDENAALFFHLGADLLAHGAPEEIGLSERIAGKLLRDLHHLLLIDDNALRLGHQMVDLGMDRGDFFLAMLARIVGRDVFHRAGAIKRHQRDDVLNAIRLHADQSLAHARRFHLEHADHLSARKHGVGLFVVQRNFCQVDVDAAPGNQLDRRVEHGQRLQPEKVEFDEARILDLLHVELRDRHVGSWVAIHRHQIAQRPVADDDARRVGGGMAVEALELLRDLEKLADDRLLLYLLAKTRLTFDGFCQRHRVGRVGRHHLAQPIDLAVGHLQDAAYVAQHRARLQRSECDDLCDLVASVFLLNVADHLVAALLAEVDVEIGHRHAVGVQEPLEQEREP